MASVSAANLSTKAKIDVSSLPAFSEEVISSKNPRSWNDLPEHILLKIFDSLAKDDDNGRAWVSGTKKKKTAKTSARSLFPSRPTFFFEVAPRPTE